MTIQLNLPPDLEQFVAAQAKSEGHPNPDAFKKVAESGISTINER